MKQIKMILIVFLLIKSCSINGNLLEIKFEDIFNVKENKYVVYFYSSTCRACLDTLELLNKRYLIEKYPGFLVKTNNIDITFKEEKVSNLDVTKYQDIVISSVPYLVFVDEKRIVKELFGYSEIHKENLYIFFE